MAVQQVASTADFDAALKRSSQALAYFRADWSEPCKQMDAVVAELAKRHPTVAVLSVEAEAADEVVEKLGIETVPSFVLFQGGAAAGRLEGADPAALTQRVAALAAPAPAPAAAAPPGGADPGAAADGGGGLATRIEALLASAPLLLFMKGSKAQPYCGFSGRVVEALRATGHDFATFDIFSDDDVRQGLKAYSNWPTYPQLYLQGELLGGCDIVTEMAASGELKQLLDLKLGPPAPAPVPAPAVAAPAAAAAGHAPAAAAAGAGPAAAGAAGAGAGGGGEGGDLRRRLEALVRREPVMLFMKGAPDAPRCGFSRKVVDALRAEGVAFGSFDILSDEAVRAGLKELSHWPTYPQLYVNGELLGGCDIVLQMRAGGELGGAVQEMLHRTA